MKKRVLLVSLALLAVIAAVFLRGGHVSSLMKGIMLPEIEAATGTKVTARRIYVNLFPLFVEADGLTMSGRDGKRILSIRGAKAYIDLSGFIARRADIRRLVIKDPEVVTDDAEVREIAGNIRNYAVSKKKGTLRVDVLSVEIQNGTADFRDRESDISAEAKGFNGEIILGKTRRVRASVGNAVVRKGGWPEIGGSADVLLTLNGDRVRIRRLEVNSLGSTVRSSGEYGGRKGRLETNINLMFSSLKKIFRLDRRGDGGITAAGTVALGDGDISVDLKLDGNFYIQTLMELLKVKEKIEGLVDIKGRIEGPLRNIRAAGTMTLKKGNVFNVAVDSLTSKVRYADGVMKFTDGLGGIYGGTARVSASIHLPVVNYYTIAAGFSGLDSKPVFKLIGWDPGIQQGKVTGTLVTEGAKFNPQGHFKYTGAGDGQNMLERINSITGRYAMQDKVLSLEDLKLGTGHSVISARGLADIKNRTLSFDGRLVTSDITDVTIPYYRLLTGSGKFSGRITGKFEDPVIKGHVRIQKPVMRGYAAHALDADFTYAKDLLKIGALSVRTDGGSLGLEGSISFSGAKELFDLSMPEYSLKAVVKNADLGQFAKIFYPGFRGTGGLSADVRIRGKAKKPLISGDGSVEHARIYGISTDSVLFDWEYRDRQLRFENMRIRRGSSVLTMDGRIDNLGNFAYKASSDKVVLSDFIGKKMNGDVVFSLKSKGHGTIGRPFISLEAGVVGGSLEDKPVGGGTVSARISDGKVSLRAVVLDRKVHITVRAGLEKELPWDASVEILPGRYDSLVGAFLKDVPEDFVLNLSGAASLHGDRSHVSASAVVRQISLSMYGRSFTGEKEISLRLDDRNLEMKDISLRSGNTSLSIAGNVVLGKKYNVVFEGNSDLAPFRSLSGRIGLLKGDADFVLSITGDWEAPQINGGVNIEDGSFALKDYPYRFSSLNGYVYMDNDRIVLQKLSGKIGGGDVNLSGVVYLKRFAARRFYVEAGLDNIAMSFSNDFSVNVGGTLLLNGTPASRMVSGDIRVNRARYKGRVEWKSWLLKTKGPERYKAEISDMEKTELNIRITGRNSIRVDNNVARADVSADVVLRGTIYRPVLLGRIESSEGTVYFRNNEFRITHASADFSGTERLNPFLSIAAETDVKGYKIKMNLEGQLDRFNVSLSSEDPSLKDMDIVALLAVGQTGGELKGLEGGIGASEATSFVTGKLQDVLEERMKTITGLDRFQIDPYVSKNTGTVEPRVTVSKRLLGDKVFVTYASPVGSSEEQIMKLEYFVSRKMSLVGVRDERGIVGGDVRFRFEFK
ncbi:MAG: translocation/assembly module TamB domain-containing protein [Candidatus Sulfobium sp.]|jgi:autotransporter translocation and assembly factor TamB